MIHKKVIVKRIVSPDGKSVAQARSAAFFSGDSECAIAQTTVKVSSSNSYSSSFSSSSSSSSASSSNEHFNSGE